MSSKTSKTSTKKRANGRSNKPTKWPEELKKRVGSVREQLEGRIEQLGLEKLSLDRLRLDGLGLDKLGERVQALRKNPSNQAKKLRKELDKQLDQTHAQLLDTLGLASRRDLDKLNRKLNNLNKKLAEVGKAA